MSRNGKTPNGVSIVVPCYNESDGIRKVVNEIREALRECPLGWEILVVDDGSSDETASSLEGCDCRLLSHPENRGYGAALKTGVGHATHDLIGIIDADGTYPCSELPILIDIMMRAGCDIDMVVGSRTGHEVKIPPVRRPAKWALNALADYLTGRRIPDLNSGLRIIRRELWDRYEKYYPDGFSLTTTITLAALTNGWNVVYHPVNYRARIGTSKIRPVRDTIGFVQLILRTVLYFDPLKVFVPASLILFLAGAVIGGGSLLLKHWFGVGQFMDVTTVVLLVSSLQLLAMGALADLITKRLQ
jgi:glycosyltransferase involved in cell wall biosynthesis